MLRHYGLMGVLSRHGNDIMTGFTVHFISFVSTIKVNITKQKTNWSSVENFFTFG